MERSGHELPADIVYDNTTVRSLATALYRIHKEAKALTAAEDGGVGDAGSAEAGAAGGAPQGLPQGPPLVL